MIPGTYCTAVVMVCSAKMRSMKDDIASFPAVTASSFNVVSYDTDLVLRSVVPHCRVHLEWLSAVVMSELMACVARMWIVLDSSRSCDVGSRW